MKQILLVLFCLLAIVKTNAQPCNCPPKTDTSLHHREDYVDYIIRGTVVDIKDYHTKDSIPNNKTYLEITVIVQDEFKAPLKTGRSVKILTTPDICGFEFELNKDYIIYALKWKEFTRTAMVQKGKKIRPQTVKNHFLTSKCWETQLSNPEEIAYLRMATGK